MIKHAVHVLATASVLYDPFCGGDKLTAQCTYEDAVGCRGNPSQQRAVSLYLGRPRLLQRADIWRSCSVCTNIAGGDPWRVIWVADHHLVRSSRDLMFLLHPVLGPRIYDL